MGLNKLKYLKPQRIPLGNSKNRKNMLNPEQVHLLLRGKVAIEEKMDGKPKPFETENHVIFTEDMKKQHSIFYVLPGRYAVFDIYDKKRGVFVFPEEKVELAKALRQGKIKVNADSSLFFPVPEIGRGKIDVHELPELLGISAYAFDRGTREKAYMEGIVVKPDRDMFPEEFLAGKLVREEFEEGIKTHHIRMPARYNIINPSLEVILSLQNERLRASQIPSGLRHEL